MTSLRVIDWFSGIGGFHLAFSRAGHQIVGACELNPFTRRVYTKRFGAPAWFPSDINEVTPDDVPEADLWVAGSPCQGFSRAGLGLGLEDPRSGLLRRLLWLLAQRRPRFFLLENVPGILTANGGRDFGELLATLDWLGYVGRGQLWTHATSEWCSGAVECFLWQVLETDSIPVRFFLSPKACLGILRRAERRKRTLPGPLAEALARVAGTTTLTVPGPSSSKAPGDEPTDETIRAELSRLPAR